MLKQRRIQENTQRRQQNANSVNEIRKARQAQKSGIQNDINDRIQAERADRSNQRRTQAQHIKSGQYETKDTKLDRLDRRASKALEDTLARPLFQGFKEGALSTAGYMNKSMNNPVNKAYAQRLGVSDDKIKQAERRNDLRDQGIRAKLDKVKEENARLTESQTGLRRAVAEGATSWGSMMADTAFGPMSLINMGARVQYSSEGDVKKKVEPLKQKLLASGNYTPEEVDEMFKDVDKWDVANSLVQAGTELFTEKMFGAIGPAAQYGEGMLDKVVGRSLTRMLGSKVPKNALTRLAGAAAEEVAEEEVGGPLGAFLANKAYGNKLQAINEDATRRELQNIDPERANALLSSKDFNEQEKQIFMQSGASEEEAVQLTEKFKEYLAAKITGDTEKEQQLQQELTDSLAGGENSLKEKWTLSDAINVAASTTAMMAMSGSMSAITTSSTGNQFQQQYGTDRVRQLAKMAENLSSEHSEQAKAMVDRLDEGKDLSGTQVYDIMQWSAEGAARAKERQNVRDMMVNRRMQEENILVPPMDNNYNLSEVTEQRFEDIVERTIDTVESLPIEMHELDAYDIADTVAAYETGTISADQMNSINADPDNELNREVFRAMTGINLDQFNQYDRNGNIDTAKTNEVMQNALFAKAADNYMTSARMEQENWNSKERGAMAQAVSKNLGSQGDLATYDAMMSVDPADRNKFMLMGDASQNVYDHAYNTQDEWRDVSDTFGKMYPSLSMSALREVYDAAKMDKQEAETPFLNAEVKAGEALDSLAKGKVKAVVRGKFENLTPLTISRDGYTGRNLTDNERVVCESLAKQFNANIYMIDAQDERLKYTDPNTGKETYSNAYVDLKSGEIFIGNAADVGKIVHEVTHMGARLASKQYLDMAHYIMDKAYKFAPERTKAMVEAYKKTYAGQGLTDAQIEEELVSDLVADFSRDETFVREISQEQPSLARRIYNAIVDVLRSLRNILATGRIEDPAVQDSFLAEIGAYEEARQLWLKMMHEAADNNALIGLAEWEDNAFRDTRESLSTYTEEQDADYMAAVDSGDMETAQRMVDEAANAAGYTYRGYHGTNAEFNVFDPEKRGNKNFMATSAYKAFFAAGSLETAESYTGLNSLDWASISFNEDAIRNIEDIKKNHKYDEAKAENDKAREEFETRYKYDHNFKEKVDDPIEALRQAHPEYEETDIFKRLAVSLEAEWNKEHLNDMWSAWENSEENAGFKEFSRKITDEVEQSEIERRGYKPHVLNLAIKLENPLVHDYNEEGRDFDDYTDSFSHYLDVAKEQGNDGCIFLNVADGADFDTIFTVFDGSQFKSSDPVTYDDDGNVIPLSERFDTADADIRYSKPTEYQALPKTAAIPKELRDWAKEIGLDELSKNPVKGPVIVSVRSLRDAWYDKNGRSEEAKTINTALDSISDKLTQLVGEYRYIDLSDALNATVSYRTDSEGHPTSVILSCQVKNAEYEVNFDFTTICAKRLAMQKVLEKFIKTEGESKGTLYDELKLDEEGLYKLRLILEQAGFEVSCRGCFVEQNRYSQQNQARTIANDWNAALDAWAAENGTEVNESFDLVNMDINSLDYDEIEEGFKKYHELMKGKPANVETKNRMLIESSPFFRKRMNPSDYASISGQQALMAIGESKKGGTNLYGLLKRGQSDSKQSVPFTAYNGEVALLPDKMKGKSLHDYLVSIGGARAQSASDFQIEFVYDYMQLVADLSARGLPMHMYTKVIELAELFGMTGIKINLSAMCDVDESLTGEYAGLKLVDGKYEYNISDQSIDYPKAVELQKKDGYSKNIGIIMVVLSKEHMLKSLSDNDVRYIIGYHSSSMPVVVANMSKMGDATDYTKLNKTSKLTDKGRALFEKAKQQAKGDTELARYKDALRIFDDMIQEEVSTKKNKPRRGNEYGSYMTPYKGNTGDFNTYDDIQKTNDARKTADNYIEDCMKNDLVPMYFPFAFHENYYKCEVYDFNMYDNVSGEYAPMEGVRNIYPGLNMEKGETDTTKYMSRVSEMMNERNKFNETQEAMYEPVMEQAKKELRYSLPITGDDYMDFDASGIDHSELLHRSDVSEEAKRDEQYMSAVESGDMEEAQRLVDEAAQAAGTHVSWKHGCGI